MTIEQRQPGDKRIPSKDWNALATRYNAGMIGGVNQSDSSPRNPVIVLVKNNTGGDLGRRAIVGLGDSALGVTGSAVQWKNEIVIDGEIPEAGTHDTKFAVLIESIADGMVGEAIVMGVTQVLLNVVSSSDTHAAIEDGETDYLTTGTSGAAEIIWKESGTGEKLGLVLIDRAAAPVKTFRRVDALMANESGTNLGELLDQSEPYGCIHFNTNTGVTEGGLQIPAGNHPFANGTVVCMETGTYRFDFNITMIKSFTTISGSGGLASPPAGTYYDSSTTGSGGTPSHTHSYNSPTGDEGSYFYISVYFPDAGVSSMLDSDCIFQATYGFSFLQQYINISGSWYRDLVVTQKKYIRINIISNHGGSDTQRLCLPFRVGAYDNIGTLMAVKIN